MFCLARSDWEYGSVVVRMLLPERSSCRGCIRSLDVELLIEFNAKVLDGPCTAAPWGCTLPAPCSPACPPLLSVAPQGHGQLSACSLALAP